MLDRLLHDTWHAWAALRRAPLLTAGAVLVLALATGATTAIFSLVHGVLLRPLPWPDSDRLVRLREFREGDVRGWRYAGLTNETFDAWQRSARTIDALAAWSSRAFTLSGRGDPVRLQAAAVTPSLFGLLGFVPVQGRPFRAGEGQPGSDRFVVLGHALWRDRFGADPGVVGGVVSLEGEPYTVVGVAPPTFYFPDRETSLWVPLFVPPPDRRNPEERNVFFFSALGRLRAGAATAQASSEGTAMARQQYDRTNMAASALFGEGAPRVEVRPLLETVTATVRPALTLLFAAVGLVLLVACANLASLLLSRGLARRREFAVRAALGAGATRLAQQLLVESVLIGLAGGLLGLGTASLLIGALPALAPADFPRLADVSLDGTVLAFSLAVALTTALLFGAGPAVQASRVELVPALAEGGHALGGGLRRLGANRARSALLVLEIALAITLLVGSGLLVRSFVALTSIDQGYDPSNVLTARVSFPPSAYTPQRTIEALDTLLSRLRDVPGVAAAGTINLLPLVPGEIMVMFTNPLAANASGPQTTIRARLRVVSPGLVEALGLHVPTGRSFTWSDTAASLPALLVNEAFVREHLSGRHPLDTRLPGALEGPERDWHIVGVVGDLRQASLNAEPMPEVWVSWTQLQRRLPMAGGTMTLVVRTAGDPFAVAPRVREILRGIDPTLALADVATMERRIAASVAQPRFAATLLGSLALVALALAAAGIYGVLAYGVAQRHREIGVRSVLGATPARIVRLVVGQGLGLTALGVALGLGGALAGAPLMASLLYGVRPADGVTLVAVVTIVAAVAALAALVPARRAARVDPAETLRAG